MSRCKAINGKTYILVLLMLFKIHWTSFSMSKEKHQNDILKDFLTMIQRKSSSTSIITVRTGQRHEILEQDSSKPISKKKALNSQTTSTPRTPNRNALSKDGTRTLG
ncbi:hypothetical protein Tco_0366510 [Tanacetum coccineum]